MRKIIFSLVLLLVLIPTVFIGCSSRTEQTANSNSSGQATDSTSANLDKKKISLYSQSNDKPVQEVYKQIVEEFEKENQDIDVDLQFPGVEYENILKVKMAANDMPDAFDTHGWAQVRYGKYLADLREEKWTADLTDTIKPVVTDKDGKVYALVLSEAKDGLTYNEDILKKYKIKPPKTFDELVAASEKIYRESNGKTVPFFFSGIDSWTIGQFFDYFATSQLISGKQNETESLLNNTFDWNKWNPLPEKFLDLYKKGLINQDVLTAKYSDLAKLFAEEKVAFSLQGPQFADEVHKINPNLKIGLMPVPSMVPVDEPNFSGGERFTMGAWKDSKHLPEVKRLIAYFAKKENMTKFAKVTKLPPGLKGINTQHEFSEYYDAYSNIRVFPYFDRVYLPNGMWDVMCKQGAELLAGEITPEQYSETMKQEVERLRNK